VILVVGLGNPGPRYARTRHNAGFLVLDALATRGGRVASFRPELEGEYSELELGGARVGLLKPGTFMNASGRSVRAACSFFELAAADLLVVHDELDIPFGELRLKSGGGDGGHRGLRSITSELRALGQAEGSGYGRLRVGIGRPPPEFEGDIADFVLQAVAPEEPVVPASVLEQALEVVEQVVRDGLSQTMNRTNQRMLR
jgi:PTH1 family peptidyl-tRNA hydrolase